MSVSISDILKAFQSNMAESYLPSSSNNYNCNSLVPQGSSGVSTLKSIYECPWFLKVRNQERYYMTKIQELERRTGYKMSQKCGQRIYSDPPGWTGPPPPRGSEVFLAICRTKYEFDLEPILSTFGQIYDLRLMVDFSGTNRGFAYVRYATPEIARNAVRGLNVAWDKHDIIKKAMMSDDNCELFVYGIPLQLTRDEIYEHFSRRTDRLVSVVVCASRIYNTPNRGFCFLEYANHSYAAQARRELLLDLYIQEWRAEITVNWSIPDKMKNEPNYVPGKTIHVSNINNFYCTYSRFTSLLAGYTETQFVTSLKVFHNKAFVEFSTHEEANYALHLLEGVRVDDRSLHVSWARPMKKSRERDNTLRELTASRLPALRVSSHSIEPEHPLYNQVPASPGRSGFGLRAEAPPFEYKTSNSSALYPNIETSPATNAAGNVAIANCNINVNSIQLQDTMNSVAQAPTSRYRGATPLPNIMAARFAAIPNINYENSLHAVSPGPLTPVTYLPRFNYPQWSTTGQPMSPTLLSAPRSPALLYPPAMSPSLMYTGGIMSPVPRSPSTPVYPTSGNFFGNYF